LQAATTRGSEGSRGSTPKGGRCVATPRPSQGLGAAQGRLPPITPAGNQPNNKPAPAGDDPRHGAGTDAAAVAAKRSAEGELLRSHRPARNNACRCRSSPHRPGLGGNLAAPIQPRRNASGGHATPPSSTPTSAGPIRCEPTGARWRASKPRRAFLCSKPVRRTQRRSDGLGGGLEAR
jgi:hypothetical protein